MADSTSATSPATESAYASVVPGRLKLKSASGCIDDRDSKKRKRSKKAKKRERESASIAAGTSERSMRHGAQEELQAAQTSRDEHAASVQHVTKAELAFRKMQERMQEKRIMEKASQTHKQRVEKFNQALDNLTEFYDIPKVSWTK